MSILQKLISITVLLFLSILGFHHFFMKAEVQSAFDQVEERQSLEAHDRLMSAVQSQKTYLENKLYDWAYWDETYNFVLNKNRDYVQKNIPDPAVFFKALQIDFAIVFDNQGHPKFVIVENQKDKPYPHHLPDSLILEIWDMVSKMKSASESGFMRVAGLPIMFSLTKILKGDGKGDPVGVFFAADYLDEKYAARISQIISKETKIKTQDVDQSTGSRFQMMTDSLMTVRGLISDKAGSPLAELEVTQSRDVYMTFLKMSQRMNFMIFVPMLLLFLIIILTIHYTIIRPLQEFTTWQKELSKNGSWTTNRFRSKSIKWQFGQTSNNQEISDLASTTNLLLDQIEKSSQVIQNQTMVLINTEKIRSLGEMSAGVAHEINNPLAILMSHLTLLKRAAEASQLDREKFNSSVDKIENMSMRIKKIVSGLLAFSRDGSKDPLIPGPIHTAISDAVELTREKLRSHNISLQTELDESIVVQFRSGQISQVILNLIGNSIDAISDLDDKWIKIRLFKSKDQAVIQVIDSGPGLPVEIRDKILQPFFTTKQVGQGTGLGLSISLGIIQDHYGQFSVDHEFKNTCFVIELPIYGGPLQDSVQDADKSS